MERGTKRRSIRRRLAAALVSFAAACVGICLLVAYLGAVLSHGQVLDSSILEEAAALLERHDTGGQGGLIAEIERRVHESGGKGWMYAYWDLGTRALLAGNMEPPADVQEFDDLRSTWVGDRRVRVVAYAMPSGCAMAVAHDITRQTLFERRLLLASILAGGTVIALSIGGGLWLSRRLVDRVEQMNRTVLSILRGQRSERVAFRQRGDEFDELAEHFNELLDENERLIAQVREVTDDIAHDLRTPLARVRQELEAALARPRAGAPDAEVLQRTLDAIDALLETFQALLSIAQIESGAMRASLEPLDLLPVARDVVELYAPVAEQAGLGIGLEAEPGVIVRGNRHLLSQALSNLVDNAIKFSPAAGTIEVGARRVRDGVELRVADHGPGIPAHEREHVLQRFVRLDSARERPGTGLGLSLVAAVVKLHGARLGLGDNAPGLVVTIRFESEGLPR